MRASSYTTALIDIENSPSSSCEIVLSLKVFGLYTMCLDRVERVELVDDVLDFEELDSCLGGGNPVAGTSSIIVLMVVREVAPWVKFFAQEVVRVCRKGRPETSRICRPSIGI